MKVPEFITDVFKDPQQRGILIAGTLSILAVGLVPRVFSPGLVDAQQALKTQPQAENLLLLLSFVSAAVTILGGLVADFLRRRSVLVVSLALMAGAGVVSIFITEGVIYYAATFIAGARTRRVVAGRLQPHDEDLPGSRQGSERVRVQPRSRYGRPRIRGT